LVLTVLHMGRPMKWYDYIICIWLAYVMTNLFLLGDLVGLATHVFLYMIYEDLRKPNNA
jgi:hypothetical protein